MPSCLPKPRVRWQAVRSELLETALILVVKETAMKSELTRGLSIDEVDRVLRTHLESNSQAELAQRTPVEASTKIGHAVAPGNDMNPMLRTLTQNCLELFGRARSCRLRIER